MKKIFAIAASLLLVYFIFVCTDDVFAGPLIEFGDEGFLQMDVKLQVYAETTDFGSGISGTDDRTDIHFQRLRLTLKGMMNDTWGAAFQTCGNCGTSKGPLGYMYSLATNDWNDRDIRIIDAYVIGNFNPALNMKLGLTKIPLTRANLDDCFAPLSLERSMFVYSPYGGSPAKFSRDTGVVFWGSVFDERFKYWAGIFQGREGTNRWTFPSPTEVAGASSLTPGMTYNTSPEPKNSFEYVARLHYAFLDPEPGSGYEGTYFGKKKILTVGVGAAYEADAAFRNVVPVMSESKATSDVNVLNNETVDYKAYAADVMFEYPFDFGVLTLNSQYLKVDFDDAYKTNRSPADRNSFVAGMNGQKEGWFAKVAYILPFTLWKEGKLQPYFLYESWKFAHLLGVDEQKITQTGVGLNFYIKKQQVRITAEYLKTEFDKETGMMGIPSPGKIKDFDTFRMMFQLVL
ncbi:MAG: selenite/tellurite reduction operon porin ExtI [Thermodesulfovibrionales bacterium]